MTQKMLINAVDPEEVRIAILDDGLLRDFDIEARGREQSRGNIYLGVVTAVEPALNAAFVDFGTEKQGFLTANDVVPRTSAAQAAGDPQEGGRTPKIGDLLKPKQTLLVQVSKDVVGSKGAVLTTHLSLAGRYVVLMPNSETQGVSRKIADEETRRRAREAAQKLDVPPNMGVIVRTAGQDRPKTDLKRDLRFLVRLWTKIQKKAGRGKAPFLLHKEQDVIIRALRDYVTGDVDEIIVDNDDVYDRAAEYMQVVMPRQSSVLTRYVERRPIFHHYKVEEQLQTIYYPRVPLPSGGSLVIEPTEALVSIDVNSGRQKSSDQEDTALRTNVEAAQEVARQLRLRDLGGIIVVDFIDMMMRKNRQKVEKALKDAMKSDRARTNIGRISRNGTLELTRQRLRPAVQKTVFGQCAVCKGTGHVLSPASHALSVLRRLRDRVARGDLVAATVHLDPETAECLRHEKGSAVRELETLYGVRVDVIAEHSFNPGQDDFSFETDPGAVALPTQEPNFGPAPRLEDVLAELAGDDDGEEGEEDSEEADYDANDGDTDDQEEEMAEADLDSDGAKRKRRRRRRRKKPREEGATGERRSGLRGEELLGDLDLGNLDLDLPTYELLELSELGIETPRKPKAANPETAERPRADAAAGQPRAGGQRRQRRPTRRRSNRKRGTAQPAPEPQTAASRAAQIPPYTPPATATTPAAENKPSLFRRLLDWL